MFGHKRTPLSNAEKCRRRRLKLSEDPERLQQEQEANRERARQHRKTQKTPEQLQRQRELGLQRQKKYLEKKKAEEAARLAEGPPTSRKTRLDAEKEEKKREANRLAVQKHRSLQSTQKRRRVREKQMAYYYGNKVQREAAKTEQQRINSKATQADISGCPYPTPESYKKAVARVRTKLKAKGVKLAYLCKGMLKSADKVAQAKLAELNVTFSTPEKNIQTPRKTLKDHLRKISSKRDKATLHHKRSLAQAFIETGSSSFKEIGLTQKMVKSSSSEKRRSYKRNPSQSHQLVHNFYVDHSCPDPCKSGTKWQLLKPVKEMYKDFLKSHPTTKVSLRTFYRLRPRSVASVRRAKFRQCLCEICLNPKIKLQTVNRHLEDKCECVRELLVESVCEFEERPKRECVERKCDECGIERVKTWLFSELEGRLEESVSWSRWEHIKAGKASRMDRVKKRGTLRECVVELCYELDSLYAHVFVAEWQRKQVLTLRQDLPEGWALVTCDFAENFLCRYQDEPQSAHWGYKQITLFPAVIFYRCPCCPETRRDEVAFFSDDLKKDAHMSQLCIDMVIQRLVGDLGSSLKKVVLVSDGCAAQFKSKLPFLLFSKMSVPGVSIEKVFFGSRHGKNDSDWSGGAIKRAVTRDLATSTVDESVSVRNAKEMYEHCVANLTVSGTQGSCQHKTRNFVYLEQSDVDRSIESSSVATVVGSRKFHHLRSLAPGLLATRELCCFCTRCKAAQYELCNTSDTPKWKIVQMKYDGMGQESEPESEDDEELNISSQSTDSDSQAEFDDSMIVDSDAESCSEDSSEGSAVDLNGGFLLDCSTVENAPPDLNEGFFEGCSTTDERLQFFDTTRERLAACCTYADLQTMASEVKEAVESYPLPGGQAQLGSAYQDDPRSVGLLHEDLIDKCRPLAVEGDGNCFFRALSLLLFGNEMHHTELRVRIVLTMCSQERLFLDGQNWCSVSDDLDPVQVIHVAVLTSSAPKATPEAAFRCECMAVIGNAVYTGLWQFFAASVALNRPVQSVFPSLGWPLYQKHCNRVIRPPGCTNNKKLCIMWSSSRDDMVAEHWTSNHFVPLVLLRSPQQVPVIGSTYLIRWSGSTYPCQVLETDELLGVICVHFMSKARSGFWCWSEADYSWEPKSALVREVTLKLVDRMSTQRCQLFQVS